MIASFRVGLHHEVPLREHRLELVKRRVSAMESNARRVSRMMFKTIQGRVSEGMSPALITGDVTLESLALQYGCVKPLVPYAVTCFRQLVESKGLVRQ